VDNADFGAILEQWERGLRHRETRQRDIVRNAPPQEPSFDAGPALRRWLATHDTPDKDADLPRGRVETPQERRARVLHKRPDAALDLHGKTKDEAWRAMDVFFDEALRRGLEKLLIIHGKGNHSKAGGVLADVVRVYLEQNPHAGERGHSRDIDGGTGSTWVLLK
jgi:DNA-nicking Smr family endonuclease